MASKLDQSLDEMLSTQRKSGGGNRRRSTRRASGPAKPAPAGGIQKSVKPARGGNSKNAPSKPTGVVGESKIVVSNLPKDVSEAQIKDYFNQAVGQVKKVELSYGPGGVSRGIATVIFHHADGASKAFTELNGLLIDNRAVKVEVVVAKAELIPTPKPLGQRITQPKGQPKSAANDKRAGNAAKGGAGGAKGGNNAAANTANAGKKNNRRGGAARSGRPAKKTAEELDSEMADYFVGTAANANGTAPAAAAAAPAAAAASAPATGDAPMDDEIM